MEKYKVWYDIQGEYHDEWFNSIEEADEAYDKAVDACYEAGEGYVEMNDEYDEILEEFDLNQMTAYDDVDECGFNPYEGCYDYDC